MIALLADWWINRAALNPDGVSYLDMAAHSIRNGRIELINGYWSPLYPFFLTFVTTRRSVASPEFLPLAHAINLVVALIALALFLPLLRPARRRGDAAGDVAPVRLAVGASAFAFLVIQGIDLWLLTPDMLVLLAVLGAAACCLGIERRQVSWRAAVGLGAVLGVGYWAKGMLLPLGAAFLLLMFLFPPRAERARTKVALAAIVFAVVAAPLVAMVSLRVGRPTMGTVGPLNYAWEIDGVTPFSGWLGDSTSRFGRPVHPPRVVTRTPLTLEFATPVAATFPLWYDPSYWYAGVRPRFNRHGQVAAIGQSLSDLGGIALDAWPILVALVLLVVSTRAGPPTATRAPALLALWGAIAVAAYLLIHVESRYLAGFAAIEMISFWWWLSRRRATAATAGMAAIGAVLMLGAVAGQVWPERWKASPSYRAADAVAADTLRELGVPPGARVAVVGDAFEEFPAFLAGATIVADVVDSTAYWNLPPAGRDPLHRQLARLGVRGLLARNLPLADTLTGWHLVPRADSDNFAILPFTRATGPANELPHAPEHR